MKDVAIRPAGATAAEKAVSYLLQRMCVDANLRWYMVGTQAFSLLCDAEAERAGGGVSAEELAHEFGRPHGEPDICRTRLRLEQIADICLQVRGMEKSARAAVAEILELANE